MTDLTTFDKLKGAALIATFIGVLITFAMWVSLWENVWQAAVEPTRGAIYDARTQSPWPFAMLDAFLVMVVDGEVQADIGPVGVMVSWRSATPGSRGTS